ncbi:unnamed protein product, partial [Didymodactylos carnosus]
PPLLAITLCIGIGVVSIGGLACLVEFIRSKYTKHQQKANNYLERIENGLKQILDSTDTVHKLINHSIEKSHVFTLQMDNLEDWLMNPVYYQVSGKICEKAMLTTYELIYALHDLCNHDVSDWNNSNQFTHGGNRLYLQ